MKKLIVIALLLLTTSQLTFAQQAIAKIKFQEAEEAYTSKDYKTTITKLDEVEGILKSTNPKVMYLRIMAKYQLILYNCIYYNEEVNDTRDLCSKYLKDFENVPDNEDKYRDIYKVSEDISNSNMQKRYINLYNYYNKKSYNLNDSEAENLSSLYFLGLGIEKNYQLAEKYLLLTSNKGNSYSQNRIGYIYYMGGYGIEQDFNKAFKYYSLSAEQGNYSGQFNLGVLYRNGLGVIKDVNIAKNWFQKSAAQGYENAKEVLEELNSATSKKP